MPPTIDTVITSIHQMTPRVKQFVLRADGHTFDYKPGQHTRVVVPRDEKEPISRPYTPVNRPGTNKLVLAIKTYDEGTVSRYMHTRRSGETLTVQSLGGSLYLRDTMVPILMASTGTGITPMLAMLRQLLHAGGRQPITFFFGERTQQDLMFRETLEILAAEYDNLRVVYVLSDEELSGPNGFVQDHLEKHLDRFRDGHCYACGVPAMVVATQQRLEKLGVPADHIFTEGWEVEYA